MKRGGLDPLVVARGPGDPPGPKSMMKAWGLVRCELAKRANDGRIWPEAINGHWDGLLRKSHWTPKGGQWAINDMTWPIGPNLAPGWIAATIKEEGQTRGCDRIPSFNKWIQGSWFPMKEMPHTPISILIRA
ncbi:hypothetical protein O181_112178 [Austropuccinia psidii MF-1]|uniref:Uncharacterized protein n=1 Tax=Austropuccinia psidii MF-1 TaxID=1389203 RepID=A0A9Q3PSF3_9BASI|nr:hypothetical protein [Austropuccinia psidii MF-1]